MQEYRGPCYSFEEAQEILSMRPSELGHAIRMTTITPVVYTKNRHMLIFSHRNRRNYGHGTCMYRGHLSIPHRYIAVLLEDDPIILNEDYGTLLDPEGVQSYNTAYPFRRPTPREWLHDWNPIERDRLVLNAARATPLPNEGKPIAEVISGFTELLKSHLDNEGIRDPNRVTRENINTLKFDFRSNSTFEPQDLRIPASEITNYRQQLAVSSINHTIEDDSDPDDTPATRSRTNQLHILVARILKADPKITAKAAWQVIEDEVNKDEPLFDTENILLVVDHECIEWRSRHGKDQALLWTSFQPLLSKLRRQFVEDY